VFSDCACSLKPSLDHICSDIGRFLSLGVCVLFLSHFSSMTLAVLTLLSLDLFFFVRRFPLYDVLFKSCHSGVHIPKYPCVRTSDCDDGRHCTADRPRSVPNTCFSRHELCKKHMPTGCTCRNSPYQQYYHREMLFVCTIRVALKHNGDVCHHIDPQND
jgi:hypothetical protein